MKKICIIICMSIASGAIAQLNESFSDGDFTNGIVWTGNIASWQIVANSDAAAGATGSNSLRLNTATGSGVQFLSTQVPGSWGIQQNWGFWMGRRAQAATASNISYVWLYATEANFASTTVDGYRIRFGDDLAAGDKIILESVSNGVGTSILSSAAVPNGITDFGILVRLIRTTGGQWNLYTSVLPSVSGSGAVASDVPNAVNAQVSQGTVTHNLFNLFDNGYVGFSALHSSTSAARTGAEFDQLFFSYTVSGSLPVNFQNLIAIPTINGVRLKWDNLTESEIIRYTVERSFDGKDFNKITLIDPIKNNGSRASYQFTDSLVFTGQLFYRVSAEESGGAVLYSSIVKVNHFVDKHLVSLLPNPLVGGRLRIVSYHLPKGTYSVRIYNNQGQLIDKTQYHHGGGGFSLSHHCEQLVRGTYFLQIRGPVNINKQFLVQ